MTLIRFKVKDGTLHVPISDVKSILEKVDGPGLVSFKTNIESVVIPDAISFLSRLRQERGEASIFDQVFGR